MTMTQVLVLLGMAVCFTVARVLLSQCEALSSWSALGRSLKRLLDPGQRAVAGRAEPACDESWMPPRTVTDPSAWDRYWQGQLGHRILDTSDLFCDDGPLVDAMGTSGLRSVLCVGNGLSQEPRALAWAGFDVTVLDLSPLATEMMKRAEPPADYLARLIGGRSPGQGGRLRFVTGDLRDPTVCPGPFDVVIERRTLQLFPEDERPQALRAVADRLAPRGIFLSHCHDGCWRPPAPRTHANAAWFDAEGWPRANGSTTVEARVAWLFMTTG